RERFVKAVTETTGDASKLAALEASGLGDCVAATRDGMTAATGKVTTALACDARNAQPGCGVTFRYILQINRNNSPDEVVVQTAIAAALIIEIAGARRIGRGVSLAFERDMEDLLADMRVRPVVVEINLTSNDLILGVRGKDHPLPAYLAAGVPVV